MSELQRNVVSKSAAQCIINYTAPRTGLLAWLTIHARGLLVLLMLTASHPLQ